MGVSKDDQVLDLLTGSGAGALLLAQEYGCRVTGVDSKAADLRTAREMARDLGLAELVHFREMDPQRLELPSAMFDVVLALGGALTALGRRQTLERILVHLAPGGRVLFSDMVYLDSPPPGPVFEAMRQMPDPDGHPVQVRSNQPEPLVRIVFEQGTYHFETEADFRQLLEAMGYTIEFSVLSPESEWGQYFERAAEGAGSLDSPWNDPALRRSVAEEAGAFYAYGGRQAVGYLLLAARRSESEDF
jgi:cyclopropane fatty-acyl-phospholipid synthase-like methyltransferase